MSNSIGYIRIPRSLLENELWTDLSPAYRDVFLVILQHVCFLPRKFDDHGVILNLKPGQVCATIREIVGWCGKHGDKNIVERSIKKLIYLGFLRQEVRHKKSILTITDIDTYELNKEYSDKRSETKLRQDRDKIETQTDNVDNVDKEEQQQQVAVFFDCLKDLNLSEKSKAILSKFSEERVKLAVEFTIEQMKNGKEIKCLESYLKWHCNQTIPPITQKNPGIFAEENRLFSESMARKYISKYGRIEALSKEVEFIQDRCQSIPIVIKYTDKAFKEQFMNALRKQQFTERRI
jgi:hypothetical protein